MPSVSLKQHNAMEAAAHGKSTLGIPRKVGQEFSSADKGKSFSKKKFPKKKKSTTPKKVSESAMNDYDEDDD